MKRTAGILLALFCAGLVYSRTPPAVQKPVSDDVFKSGAVRFVPEITITDEAWGGKGFFGQPSDVAVDDKGRIYVSDAKENNIKIFDAAGAYLKAIGRTGQGPGEFNYPMEVEYSHGRLYIRELMNRRVSIFDTEGVFVKSIPISSADGMWWEVRALPDGRFLVQKEIVDFGNFNAPQICLLDLHSADLAYIKTLYRHEIRRNKYIREPMTSNVPVPFASIVHWAVLPDGKVVIGYSGSYEIEIHDPDKGKIASFPHAYDPVEVSATDRKAYFDGMTTSFTNGNGIVSTGKGAPEYIVKNTEFPKSKPPFSSIRTDAQGRIWVQLSRPAGEKAGDRMDVFDSRGRFIGAARIEGGTFPYRMLPYPGGFWSFAMNDDGEWSVIKYRIAAAR
jgi:streptogramin lyase